MSKRVKGWVKKPKTAWLVCGGGAVLVCGGLVALQWGDNTASDTIRNIIFGLGGMGALLGIWLASMRGMRHARQSELATSHPGMETLTRCRAQLGSRESSARPIAAMQDLERLAQHHKTDPQFLKAICGVLQDFIDARAPPRPVTRLDTTMEYLCDTESEAFRPVLAAIQQKAAAQEVPLTSRDKEILTWDKDWRGHKADVEHAICMFGRILALAPTHLSGPNLSARYLPDLQIPEQDGRRSSLHKADLRLSFMPHAVLSGMDLRETDVRGAHLRGAQLLETDLRGQHLLNTNLRDAQLLKTDLRKAILSNTDLRGADLSGADARNADFAGVDLWGASLRDANLRGALYWGPVHYRAKDHHSVTAPMVQRFGKPVTKELLRKRKAANMKGAIFSQDPKN